MTKIILSILLVFSLLSCGLEKQDNYFSIKKNKEESNLENNILFGVYNEKGLDIKYEENNIEKIKRFLQKDNLSGINLEYIKGDIKNILLLIKNNINKNVELSITLKYSQLNDKILSILIDYDIQKLGIMVKVDCGNGIKDYYINKKLGEKIIDRKEKELGIALICKNDVMKEGSFILEDKNQLKKLVNNEYINIYFE